MRRIVAAGRVLLMSIAASAVIAAVAVAQENETEGNETEAVEVELVAADPEDDGQADLEELQWEELDVADNQTLKLRAHVDVQRALLRRACDLTAAQEKTVEQWDHKWIDKVIGGADANALAAQQPGLIMRFFGGNPRRAAKSNPTAILKRALTKQIDELLTEQQKLRYQAEMRSRNEFRASATAAAIVETLYEPLGLTTKQADAITKSIRPWVTQTDLRMLTYFSNAQYYPNVPEQYLRTHLSSDQLNVYRGLTRHLFTDENFNDGQQLIVIER